MRVMMIAGEPSGDLHGSGVVRELKRSDPATEIFGIGGENMQREGMDLVYHVRELSVMGFLEVIQHLPLLRSVERTLTSLLKMKRPDVVVLIDYPGFNLRFARVAKSAGIPVVYYISPQVWAWNAGRVKNMRGRIDRMLVVFPFEVDIYRAENIPVEWVGHPLVESLREPQAKPEFCTRYGLDAAKPIVGLFPGSRKQELERIFPAMIGAARKLHADVHAQIVVGAASILDLEFVRSFLRDDFPVVLVQNVTHDVMANADLAIVTSGTATLETACYKTPMIVVYRTSGPTYAIGRMVVNVKNISLVNIVAGREIVPELIQGKVNPGTIAALAGDLLRDEKRRARMSVELADVRSKLGSAGASTRVAAAIRACAVKQ